DETCESDALAVRVVGQPVSAERVLRMLLAGPGPRERARGLDGAFDASVSFPKAPPLRHYLIRVEVANGVARVSWRAGAEHYLGQVACAAEVVDTAIER